MDEAAANEIQSGEPPSESAEPAAQAIAPKPFAGVIKSLALSAGVAAMVYFTVNAMEYSSAAAQYEDFLLAPAYRAADKNFAVSVYNRFRSKSSNSGRAVALLDEIARESEKSDAPLPAAVPGAIAEDVKEKVREAASEFPAAFYRALMEHINLKSRRDALIAGGVALAVVFFLLIASSFIAFVFTRVLKLALMVGLAAWLVLLGLYLWPKKAEREESHKTSLARLEITLLEIALREYRIEQGKYPPAGNESLVHNLSGGKEEGGEKTIRRYFDFKSASVQSGSVLDPWGAPYRYLLHASEQFQLYSAGPNGIDERGNGDDISCPPPYSGWPFDFWNMARK